MKQFKIIDGHGYNFIGTLPDCKWWLVARLLERVPEGNEIVRIDENTVHYRMATTKQLIQSHTIV